MYKQIVKKKFLDLKNNPNAKILAIETSCDETSVAVTMGRQVLSNIIASQIEIHRRFGGVVPEIASRNHTLAIQQTTAMALESAGVELNEIDAIAVTKGAGLLGALLVGVSFAKGLSYAQSIPLIGVNHISGHIASNYINSNLTPPYICLVASGGHSAIVKVESYTKFKILGTTADDSAGEAFDKVARVLGLPYPGGPEIEKLAKTGNNNIQFPKAFKAQKHYNFSYSGLKTAVINYVHNAAQKSLPLNKADVACSFQQTAISMLADNVVRASLDNGKMKIVLAGGVCANQALRAEINKQASVLGVQVHFPPSLEYCTDNAGMIGVMATIMANQGVGLCDLSLDANANLLIDEI